MAGQGGNPGGAVGITAPTASVRGPFRLRPWAGRPPEPGAHGRRAEGGSPKLRLERVCAGQRGVTRAGRVLCASSGTAYRHVAAHDERVRGRLPAPLGLIVSGARVLRAWPLPGLLARSARQSVRG